MKDKIEITDSECEKIFEEMFDNIDLEFMLMQLTGLYPTFPSIEITRKELEDN